MAQYLDLDGLTTYHNEVAKEVFAQKNIVIEFDNIVTDNDITVSDTGYTGSTAGKVVYSTAKKNFVYAVTSNPMLPPTYYSVWNGGIDYIAGSTPISKILYVNKADNKIYRWDGSALVEVSAGSVEGGLTLGTSSTTAYPGDKGDDNAKAIAAIKEGDKPVCVPSITTGSADKTSPWTLNKSDCIISTSGNNIVALAGSVASFNASFTWKPDEAHKDPTECSGNFGTTLPAKNQLSAPLKKDNINTNTTFTVTLSAAKEGLVVDNGSVKWASGSEKSSASASASISFQYKAVNASVTSAVSTSSLKDLLEDTSTGTWKYATSRAKTFTNLTVASNEYFVYAYPKSLGALTKIVMNDATPLIDGGFTVTELGVVEPRTGITMTYYVYTSVQKGAFTNAKLVME